MIDRKNNFQSCFDTLRLHLRLVRALPREGGYQECVIHRACDSLQVGLPQVHKGLHLDVEVLRWSKLDESGGTQNETKNNPQLNVCTSLADSYSSSRATTASEIEERS